MRGIKNLCTTERVSVQKIQGVSEKLKYFLNQWLDQFLFKRTQILTESVEIIQIPYLMFFPG